MYIDPNTGGMLFQVLAGVLVAGSGILLFFSRNIRVAIAKLRRKTYKEEGIETKEQNYQSSRADEGSETKEQNNQSSDDSRESPRSNNYSQNEPSGKLTLDSARNILGVRAESSDEEIRKAYLKLVKKYHPDKVFNLADEYKVIAEKKMKEINSAYELLNANV